MKIFCSLAVKKKKKKKKKLYFQGKSRKIVFGPKSFLKGKEASADENEYNLHNSCVRLSKKFNTLTPSVRKCWVPR